MIITKTPLRVSFFGGGTDFPEYFNTYGSGATLSVTINKYIYLAVNKCVAPHIRVIYSKLEQVDDINDLQHDRVKAALERYNIRSNIEIASFSDIPTKGSGLGSSSTFTVGLVHALEHYNSKFARNVSPKNLAEMAFAIEKDCGHVLGLQDHYAAAYGGFNLINYEANYLPHVIPIDPSILMDFWDHLLFFDTGITRDATPILTEQVTNMDDSKGRLSALMNHVFTGRYLLEKRQYDQLGELLHVTWNTKKSLADSISNERIDDYYEMCRQAGAGGGKLLGAGGGGYLMIYARKHAHPAIRKKMKLLGLTELSCTPSFNGSTLEIV